MPVGRNFLILAAILLVAFLLRLWWSLAVDADPAGADLTFSYGAGISSAVPVVGDWDGDGDDTIGIYEPSTGLWLLPNASSTGAADLTFGYGADIGDARYHIPLLPVFSVMAATGLVHLWAGLRMPAWMSAKGDAGQRRGPGASLT